MAVVAYSFIIPVFNEDPVLPELYRRLGAMVGTLDGESEFIFVDDGSSDRSVELLLSMRERDDRVKLVSLSRNFGHQLAISAGLDFASGKAIVIMDADLQDPPEVVPKLVERWKEGYDVVYAVRAARPGDSRIRRRLIRLAYKVLSRWSDTELPPDAGDFRLVDSRVVDIVRNMRESSRYMRGMFAWVGFRQTGVHYERPERFAGESKYPLPKLIGLAIDGLTGFSAAPLRIMLGFGFAIAGFAFVAGLLAAVAKLLGLFGVPGWASLITVLTFFTGVQLIVMGTIGLYVARIFEESRGRPLYLVDRAEGFESGVRAGDDALVSETGD
jgi:glycosyltransferase involved in cell wall biosynthesis